MTTPKPKLIAKTMLLLSEADAKKKNCIRAPIPADEEMVQKFSVDLHKYPCMGSGCMNWINVNKSAGFCVEWLTREALSSHLISEIRIHNPNAFVSP